MDARAERKRKLAQMQDDEDDDDNDDDDDFLTPGLTKEAPREGMKQKAEKPKKKQTPDPTVPLSEKKKARIEKERLKAERRREKKRAKLEKAASTGGASKPQTGGTETTETVDGEKGSETQKSGEPKKADSKRGVKEVQRTPSDAKDSREISSVATSELPSPPPSTSVPTPPFEAVATAVEADAEPLNGSSTSAEAANAETSASAAVSATSSEKRKALKIPADTTALRARLAARIQELRAARKADGEDGKPIRTRQELIEQRRIKQMERKAHKKLLRKQAKEAEARQREEALAANSSRSSPLSSVLMSPAALGADKNADPMESSVATNLSFGRVTFADGARLSHDLGHVLSEAKKKGPSDPKTALIRVQNEKQRLASMTPEARESAQEKEAWLTARRRAEGTADRVRDDEALLKKALKRKEKQKKRSEKAWAERVKGVETAMQNKQKRREENIRKRKEDKLERKLGLKKKKSGSSKKKARPGFEGSFGVGKRKQK